MTLSLLALRATGILFAFEMPMASSPFGEWIMED
jgi:hypothetical protein